MALLKVFANIDENRLVLRFEGMYVGGYDKAAFGVFMDVIHSDYVIFHDAGSNHDELFVD
jgi:hypothetical protein